ncbi:MAG: hypothetical protein ABI576_13565 [Flavobacterium sp.]
MSKLRCICGHTIVDQSDNLEYKAHFIRDQNYEAVENYSDDIDLFINSIKNNNRDKWTEEYFGIDVYKKLSDSIVIRDIISRYKLKYESEIYQCKNCGRIKIQKGLTNLYASFKIEDEQSMEIFNGITENNIEN